MNEGEASEVKTFMGKLRWLSDQTRPHIAYDVSELAIAAHKQTVEVLGMMNKTVTAINSRSMEIRYNKISSDRWFISLFYDTLLKINIVQWNSLFFFLKHIFQEEIQNAIFYYGSRVKQRGWLPPHTMLKQLH